MPQLSFIKKNKLLVVMLNHYSTVVLPSQHFSVHQDPCWIHHLPLCPFPESSLGSANEKEMSQQMNSCINSQVKLKLNF